MIFIVILGWLFLHLEWGIYARVLKIDNLLRYLFGAHTIFCLIFQLTQSNIFTMQQLDDKDDPIRIIIIGLPYSGKDEVARILVEKYKCQLIEMKNLDPKEQEHKGVAKLCFSKYDGRGVLVLDPCHSKTLYHLKKRNFVNVISVDAPFKKRLQLYCEHKKIDINLSAFQQFSNRDSDYQTDDYRKCLQFVRIRLYNDKDIPELANSIEQNISEILRPFRPTYDEYFMKMADIAKRRSNCMKSSVGCVIVNDSNRVVSTGFNGTPRGLISCFKNGCTRCNSGDERGLDECLCLHGEESAILEVGISRTQGCKLYTTLYPCFSCAKIIKQAGIKKIYYMQPYLKIDSGQKFLKQNFQEKDVVQVKVNSIYY